MGLHMSGRQCLPASVFSRLRHPPAATREGDDYCWETPVPGLGDRIAAALTALGITEERVSRLLGRPCGCSRRRRRMNEWGKKVGIG